VLLKEDILRAAERIRPHILKTPLMNSTYFSALSAAQVYFKLENEQHTGSFKLRGATNKILSLTEGQKKKGVLTASTGNHGKALARALQGTAIKGVIYVPENADSSKVDAIKSYGIEVKAFGTNSLETELHAKKMAAESGMVWISPYNDLQIIAGQGTIAAELMEQLDNIDAVFVTVGGGGLISGIGTYLKSESPETRIIGCMPENSPEMHEAITTGTFPASPNKETLSDGSAGGFEEGAITYDLCKAAVDEFVLVSEEEIKQAIRQMLDVHNKVIEGAAAVALAAFIKKKQGYAGKNVVIIICGGNIDTVKLKKILA
jgi:threonine dehydratase